MLSVLYALHCVPYVIYSVSCCTVWLVFSIVLYCVPYMFNSILLHPVQCVQYLTVSKIIPVLCLPVRSYDNIMIYGYIGQAVKVMNTIMSTFTDFFLLQYTNT